MIKLKMSKLGYLHACQQQVCVLARLSFLFLEENHQKVGVERGVATRRAQIVMTVTVTNFEGFTRQRF